MCNFIGTFVRDSMLSALLRAPPSDETSGESPRLNNFLGSDVGDYGNLYYIFLYNE